MPFLSLHPRLRHGTLLVVLRSAVPPGLRRFQINPHGLAGNGPGDVLSSLDTADFDTAYHIRQFCADLHQGDIWRLDNHRIVAWLREQVASGQLAALWIETEGYVPQVSAAPVKAASAFSPSWSTGQKIVAMFKAVPPFLPGAAKAQFEAFISPENLAIMAGFLAFVVAAQAIPGADAVVDAALVAVAWASTGWAGVVAAAHLTEAVIAAGNAKNESDITAAARLAAEALITLGVTAFLAKLLLKAKRTSIAPEPRPNPEPPPRPPALGSTDDVMQRYARGNDGITYPRRADQFTPDSVYDPKNPTADQRMAFKQLGSQLDSSGNAAWNDDKIKQVLDSGSDFTTKSYAPGDNLFKIGNANLDPATPSPYLLDQNGMNTLIDKGYVSQDMQVLDPAGVKQGLALPCYNAAQSVFQGQVTQPATGVVSRISPAHELFSVDNGVGGVTEGQVLMTGGGSQVSLPPSAVSFGH